MRRKERSRSPDRGDTKRCCLQTETTKPDILSTIADHVLAMKKKYLEEEQQSDIYVPPLGQETLHAADSSAFPLLPTVMDFLNGKRQVMLLMGDAGSGKTYFLRQLERYLWAKCKASDDPIPILFGLSDIDKVDSDLLGQVLEDKGLDKHQIRHLKNNNRHIILLCDSYDELQVQRNIYNCNKFNTPGQGRVKLIIACRSSKIGWNSDGRFRPEPTDKYDLTDLDLFQKVAMAPFTYRQIKDYITKYVGHHHQLAARQVPGDIQSATQQPQPETPPPPEIIRVWSVLEYMETLADTPNLMELVENPFILSVVLKLLSSISRSALDAVRPSIPLDALYQHIFECWIEVSERRLHSRRKTEDENLAFDALTESGFADLCMAYMKSRVVEIFKHPKKASSTRSILNGAAEWSARCFVTDTRESLLLESVPLNRSKATGHFIRPSLLEYIYSLMVFCPNDLGKGDTVTDGFTTNDSDSDNSEATPEVTSSTFVNGGAFDKGHPLSFINIADRSTLVQLLADRAQKCQSFKEWLIERVRESSNSDDKGQKLAANAMTILVTAGMQFNSADLRGIKIKGANLTGGKFDSADLRDADLTGTTLAGCCMRQANLQGTQLRKARFEELPLVELNGVPTTFARPLDGRLYAVGFANGSITVFDATSWIPIHTHQESKESITALAFSPKSDLLSFSFGHKIGLIKTWNHTNNKMSESFGEHDGSINGLVYSPHGTRIATAAQDGKVGIWNAASGERIIFLDAHRGGVSSVAFSPDGDQLVSGGFDNILRLWNLETGVLVSTLEGHKGAISQVIFSPNGRSVASSSSDNTVRTWSTLAGTWGLEMIFRGHSERVTSIAYSPTERHIVSCSDDRTIRMWDTRSGGSGPVFGGHTDQVVSIAFSPDGKQLVSCGRDKALRVWDCRAAVKGAVIFGRTNTISSGMYPYSTFNRDATDNDKTFNLTRPWFLTCTFRSEPFGTDATSFVISPNGFLVASACTIDNSPTVVVWYRETNERRHDLHGHEKKISSIVFSPDSLRIVSGDFKGVLRVCDAQSGALIWTQKEHKGKVTSIAYSSNGDWIASGSEDDTVRLWNASGDMVHAFNAEDSRIRCVAFSPSGSWIASCGEDGTVRLWNPNNLVPGAILEDVHDGTVNSIAFSPDDVHIASGGDDSIVRIWNINTGAVVHVLERHVNPVRCLAYSPSGKYIASASDDCTLKIWNVGSGELESTGDHDQGVSLVYYSSDGAFILTGTKDYKAHSWIHAYDYQDTAITSTTAVSKGGKHVASSLGGKTVQLWDTESGELGPNLYGHTGSVDSVSFSPFGDFIATASSDGTVRIWDTTKGDCLEKLEGHTGIVTCVVFSPNGKQIATSGFDQTLRWWDLSIPDSDLSSNESGGTLLQESEEGSLVTFQAPQTDEQTYKLGTPLHEINRLPDGIFVHDDSGLFYAPVYSPDGKEISVISGQHGVLRFDTQSKIAHPALVGHSNTVTCIAYSPPGDRIATSSDDGTARIWDPQTGNELLRLERHRGCVTSVAFSPFSYQLATSSADGTVRVWDVPVNATHEQIVDQELTGHIGPVLCVAYSPDGKFLASGGEDRTMRLWDPFSGYCFAEVRDFAVGVKTIQWRKSARGGLVLVTGCKGNPLQVWELVSLNGEDLQVELRKRWGMTGVDSLSVSGARFGNNHGLSPANRALLVQRGAIFEA